MVYSSALFELAIDKGMVREYSRELEIVKQVVSQNPKYLDFLSSQIISDKEKFEAVDRTFVDFHKDVVSFLKLLCAKSRTRALIREIENFHSLENKLIRVLPVKVITAVPLDLGQKEVLINKLKNRYSMKISPVFELDRSIIGGIRIVIGDKVLERSVVKSLKTLKEVIS